MDIANATLSTSPLGQHWIELFHSTSLWPETLITFKIPTAPAPLTRRLLDASHVREGFRVFRVQLSPPTAAFPAPITSASAKPTVPSSALTPSTAPPPPLRFRLRPPEHTLHVAAAAAAVSHQLPRHAAAPHGGRFVVADNGVRHVGAPDIAACLRAYRPHDTHIELTVSVSQAPSAAIDGPAPCLSVWILHARQSEQPCALLKRANVSRSSWQCGRPFVPQGTADLPPSECAVLTAKRVAAQTSTAAFSKQCGEHWFLRFPAPHGAVCSVGKAAPHRHDTGNDDDTSNEEDHLLLFPLPGKYFVEDGVLSYKGPAEIDQQLCGT